MLIEPSVPYFEIVAHRGATVYAPENTMEAFEHAVTLGADWIELDMRLTSDKVPVVYHYFYMFVATPLAGPIFDYTYDELRSTKVFGTEFSVPSLAEVLHSFSGRIKLEIELKGPEMEAIETLSGQLLEYRRFWNTFAVTSTEPVMLLGIKEACPELDTALIYRAESWMGPEVIAYDVVHRARLANCKTVHLLPQHISHAALSQIRSQGIIVHSGPTNDLTQLQGLVDLGITKICTDKLDDALHFRKTLANKADR